MDEEKIEGEQPEAEAVKRRKKITDYIGYGGIVGIIAGGIAGYLYYYYIGCRSGSCPINSNPYFTILWGAIIGYLLGDMFKKPLSRKHK